MDEMFTKDPMSKYYTTQPEDVKRAEESLKSKNKKSFVDLENSWQTSIEKAIAYVRSGADSQITVPYTQIPLVRIAVDKISSAVGTVPYEFYSGQNEVYNHPLIRLLNKPNNYINSLNELFSVSSIFLSLKGECFWYYGKSLGQIAQTSTIPSEIQLLDPTRMNAVLQYASNNMTGDLVGWIYDGIPISLDEVTQFRYFNIYNIYRGISKLDSMMVSMDSDYRAAKYNQRLFQNSAEPGVVIELAKDAPDPSKEEKKKFIEVWNKRHQGDANQHKIAITPPGAIVKTLGLDHEQMQFLQLREFSQKEILGIYGVPLGVVFPDANYATAESHKKQFWNMIVGMLRMQFEGALNSTLFPKFAPELSGWFNFDEIKELQDDQGAKAEVATKYFQMGVPLSEINEKLDLGFELEDPLYDISYVPSSMVPAGQIVTQPTDSSASLQIVDITPVSKPKLLENSFTASYRQKFNIRQAKVEKSMQKRLSRWFFEEKNKVISILREVKNSEFDDVLFKVSQLFNNQRKEISTFMKKPITESVQAGTELAYETLGIEKTFNPTSNVTLSIIDRRAKYISGISDATYKLVQTQVYESINLGETVDDLAERIRTVYNTSINRSLVISRTETCSLISDASREEYKANNISEKEWICTHDNVTRESHLASEQQGAIGIDDIFVNGCSFPGDPNGGAGEAINCRCCIIPVIK